VKSLIVEEVSTIQAVNLNPFNSVRDDAIKDVVATKEAVAGEYQVVYGDAIERILMTTKLPVFGKASEVVAVGGNGIGVTVRNRIDRALIRSEKRL